MSENTENSHNINLDKLRLEIFNKIATENEKDSRKRKRMSKPKENKANNYFRSKYLRMNTTETKLKRVIEARTTDECDHKYLKISRFKLHQIHEIVKKPMVKNVKHDCLRLEDRLNVSFDSATCIIRAIRSSILKGQWYNVTYLLLILLQYHQSRIYKHFIKKVCELNFKFNPADRDQNILREYVKMLGNEISGQNNEDNGYFNQL